MGDPGHGAYTHTMMFDLDMEEDTESLPDLISFSSDSDNDIDAEDYGIDVESTTNANALNGHAFWGGSAILVANHDEMWQHSFVRHVQHFSMHYHSDHSGGAASSSGIGTT